ncbi:MAG TPA: sugar ABC transporter permease [Candidatus Hydrogenedentes bacterium]|nr:sugar ABC transporter permease [Candidatus Hydrogenedentota bacterium]HPK00026.1 sugar ABC transporter permease [Candidatus Hydrogenedentota bacterium]
MRDRYSYTRISRKRVREAASGYLFIAPWMAGFLLFTLGPMTASAILSFCRYDPSAVPSRLEWVGLSNYIRMFTGDPLFWKSLSVTLRYSLISIPLQLAGGLALALLLNRHVRGISIYRTAFYLPMVLGGVAISLLWLWLFSPSQGLINIGLAKVFDFLGQDSLMAHLLAWPLQALFGKAGADSLLPGWISSERGALNSLILMSCWSLGGSMIINLAGLQAIPRTYYEAAEIDGAGRWTQFWRVTIPLLSPTIFFNLVMGVIGSFQVFTQGLIMTAGGPNNSTCFYVLNTYRNAFEFFRMGYASALAWFLFLIILSLTLLVVRSSSMWVFYEAKRR